MTQNQQLIFKQDYIALKNHPDKFVMMSWETDLMKLHAQHVTHNHGDVLEIGFGMGISAQFIQDFGCATHTIVESHPDILQKLQEWAKDKPNVIIIHGDWFELQDIICQKQYDGIFYDADCNRSPFFREKIVNHSLKQNGVFTYFAPNGTDKYHYGAALQKDFIDIQVNIQKNKYHNESRCACPYVIKI